MCNKMIRFKFLTNNSVRKTHIEIDNQTFDIPDFIETDRELQAYFSGMFIARDGQSRDNLFRCDFTREEQDIYDVGWFTWFTRGNRHRHMQTFIVILTQRINDRRNNLILRINGGL